MQASFDLGDEHLSTAELEMEIAALYVKRDAIQAQIQAKKDKLKWVQAGVMLRCAHCEAEHPYRDLVFLVEEHYSHTPAYEDSVYIERNRGYRCPTCQKNSWWGHPFADDVRQPDGIRRLFKSIEVTQCR